MTPNRLHRVTVIRTVRLQAEAERTIVNECPHCGRDCEPGESLCGDSDCPRHD
jgi:hypothetical protein